ncbi:MAG: B12-binding domain-containing radical SAM protein [Phycisphaerae bacterium]|jgi:pyruvate-formate lyase-activating enzyme
MNDKPSILLINPPIYDFAAFDFWLRPLGMLSAAGAISDAADFQIFDFLDRSHEFYNDKPQYKNDEWGRGSFFSSIIPKPDVLKQIPRYYRRFGLPAEIFIEFLQTNKPCDFVFIQTVMTYWYLGYREVIEAVRTYWPKAKIVLGGPYTMICPEHAKNLGADIIYDDGNYPRHKVGGFRFLIWNLYKNPETAAMKITQGCPFKCSYCTVPIFNEGFIAKPYEQIIEEFNFLVSLGVKNIAFYDDALLYKSDEVIKPFLRYVIENKIRINFHTPNALNARFIDDELAGLLVKAGFKSFYLGFESRADDFQKQTGSKIFDNEFSIAVKNLIAAGADKNGIIAYSILGHPKFEIQDIEESMKFVTSLGVRSMLAEFSPIPGTPDGELCRKYVDMDEPLMHSKTAFPIILLGSDRVNLLKDMYHKLNNNLRNN